MKARILVVDDEWDLLATYKRLLGRHGYGVVSVASREAGLAAIQADPPHLVITDLRLPDGDGLEVVRAARATTVPTPVIVVTGFSSPGARQAALAAGACAFVPKPFVSSSLTGIVRGILGPGTR